MPFPRHYLLSFGGDFVNEPTEIWSNNIRFAPDDNTDAASFNSMSSADVEGKLPGLVTSVGNFINNLDSGYGSNTRLKYVKLNEIDEQGRYKSQTQSHTAFLASPYKMGGANPYGSLATALVITFLTSAARGPASRGRVFIPQPAAQPATVSEYRISATRCNAIAAAWRTWLDSLDIGTALSPHVPSVVSDRGTGVARTINRVQVGDIHDYMGSRRNRLKENRYTSATFND